MGGGEVGLVREGLVTDKVKLKALKQLLHSSKHMCTCMLLLTHW